MKQTVPIGRVTVGPRHRKDLGDIRGLAQSIKRVGLLHPIVIAEDHALIVGRRRLEACRLLGWKEVPVRILDLTSPLQAESDEDQFRKDYTLSERAELARAIAEEIGNRQGKRSDLRKPDQPGESFHEVPKGRTSDIAAKKAGLGSGRNYEKIDAVLEAAAKDPSLVPVVEEMDRTGKVEPAFRKVKEKQKPPPAPKRDPAKELADRVTTICQKQEEIAREIETLGKNLGEEAMRLVATSARRVVESLRSYHRRKAA